MKLRYLCPNHRGWLFADEQRVEYYWQVWVDTADYYCQGGQVDQAIPFLGCTYELAEYLLSSKLPDQSVAISRFTYSSLLLAMAYAQAGDYEMQHCVLDQARDRLAMELVIPGMSNYVNSCIKSLLLTETKEDSLDHFNKIKFQSPTFAFH